MLDVVTVVYDGDDTRRAPQSVILAVLSQFVKAFGTNYFLRVIPTKWHSLDIFSDMLSGIRIYLIYFLQFFLAFYLVYLRRFLVV